MTTWNSGDAAANISLSGGSLVATTTSASAGNVRATTSKSSGKWWWGGYLNSPAGNNYTLGWANSTASLTATLAGNTNSFGCLAVNGNGNIFFNNSNLGNVGVAGVNNNFVECCFDIGGSLIWFRISGGLWNNSASANPATGTGGLLVSGIAAGPYFPVFGSNSSGCGVTANFGASAAPYVIPSGFSGLDSSSWTYEASSKFLGYAAETNPLNAESVSKLLGYAVEGSPLNAMSASKLLGYAVLLTPPATPPFTRAKQLTYLRM